jgi:hypothetical protein
VLERLSLTRGLDAWGFVFRRGLIEIDSSDYRLIAGAMATADPALRDAPVHLPRPAQAGAA